MVTPGNYQNRVFCLVWERHEIGEYAKPFIKAAFVVTPEGTKRSGAVLTGFQLQLAYSIASESLDETIEELQRLIAALCEEWVALIPGLQLKCVVSRTRWL